MRKMCVIQIIILSNQGNYDIKFLYERINGAHPKSIAVAVLLYKPGKARLDFPLNFIGFEIPYKFVVGYGLDYNQKMRHLDGLYYIPDGSNI